LVGVELVVMFDVSMSHPLFVDNIFAANFGPELRIGIVIESRSDFNTMEIVLNVNVAGVFTLFVVEIIEVEGRGCTLRACAFDACNEATVQVMI